MERKYYIICLVFAAWTIIQTSLHLVAVIYAYFLGNCQTTPDDSRTIFIYLTYLYNSRCPKPTLLDDSLSTASVQSYVYSFVDNIQPKNYTLSLVEIVRDLLERLDHFPKYAANQPRTSVFLLSFIILDGVWIVTAVSLAMGTIFGIKESLSLVFYGPWLVITVCVCVFDATASVLFGYDITSTVNFNSWIDFVGITDTAYFDDFLSKYQHSDIFCLIPSLIFCSLSTRFILIWISNWIGFILVMRATVSVCRESYKNEIPNRHRSRSFDDSPQRRSRTIHNTSADRIRNWQLFYGAIDPNTTTSDNTSTSNSVEMQSDSKTSTETAESLSGSSAYYAYTDVAESVVVSESGRCLDELRSQLPWSYTKSQEKVSGSEEKIELESRAKRRLRIKSDSSNSVTDL